MSNLPPGALGQFVAGDDFDDRRAGECPRCKRRYEARGSRREVTIARDNAGMPRIYTARKLEGARDPKHIENACHECAKQRRVADVTCERCGRHFTSLDWQNPIDARDFHALQCVRPMKRGGW